MTARDDHPRTSDAAPGTAVPEASSSTAVDSIPALLSQPPSKRPPSLRATVGELGAAAVEYAMRGLAVFPLYGIVDGRCTCRKGEQCNRPGKHPKTAHGLKDASCDPTVVQRWWRADPTANIGIATGARSRLTVLDIDGELGAASLETLVTKHELLPATPRVTTGRGWHMWLRCDEGDPPLRSGTKILPGIDIRGEGGYVVAPPSRHVSGKVYTWDPATRLLPRARPPAWLLEVLQERELPAAPAAQGTLDRAAASIAVRPAYSDAEVARIREALAAIPAEDRDTWFKVGAALHWLSEGEGWAADLTRAIWDDWSRKCREKLNPDDQVKTWESYSRAYVGQPITLATLFHIAAEHGWAPTPDAPPETPRPILPTIQITGGSLSRNATEGEDALIAAGVEIYQRREDLVRPVIEKVKASHGRHTCVPQLVPVDEVYLRDQLCRNAHWQRYSVREERGLDVNPPIEIARTILARRGEWRLRPVKAVLSTPTMRPDGSILSQPGYDPETGFILVEPPPIPDIQPTRENAQDALKLFDALLEEYPFVDKASRSVALSALITPIVRGAFPVAPMHVTSSPVAGSGKSYLLDTVAAIAIGHLMPVIAAGRNEEETEKRLGAALMVLQPLISIDNVNGTLGGDALCQAVERQIVKIRVLGLSKLIQVEPRGTTFFATGNNIAIHGDMTRRAIRGTLDPKMEHPELHQFKGNPVATVLADRGQYIAAAFCVVRAYLAAGRPNPAPKLASFEGWSDTVRSPLIWLGRADPCATMATVAADDPEQMTLVEVLAAWSRAIGTGYSRRLTIAKLLAMIDEQDAVRNYKRPELRAALLATAPRLDANGLGYWLRKYKGRIVGNLYLRNRPDVHGADWWLDTPHYPTGPTEPDQVGVSS
jgi:putative DNA primase/helicase